MKKIFLGFLISLFIFSQSYAAYEWRAGTGSNELLGTDNAADIDAHSYQNIVAPLDRLLSVFRRGAQITYASASTVTVGIGEVACSNSDGSVRKFRANTSATTVGWADIDTGSEASSTTYYVYAVADADANTFTCTISTNSSTPTGKTYYRRLGSFYNDASGNITNISNDDSIKPSYYDSGWFAWSANSAYTKNHNLGTTKIIYKIMVASVSDGSGTFTELPQGDSSSATENGLVYSLTTTTISVRINAHILALSSSASYTNMTSGYMRIIAIALE